MIEAGTYMAAVVATGGRVTIENVIPKHVESITAKLVEMGATVEVDEENEMLTVERDPEKKLSRILVKAVPYPGFPTDMQPQICALTCFAEGTSYVSEGVWDNRFRYVEELIRMGAHIMVEGKTAIIEGGQPLMGTHVTAVDLRGGAAAVIAGLAAEGITVNNLCPGVFATDRNAAALNNPVYAERVKAAIPMHDYAQPEDAAGAALLLASDAGRYITGSTILVDGGLRLAGCSSDLGDELGLVE
jgi:hypothetical protein